MADAKLKWQDAKQAIVDALDVREAYSSLGIRFASKSSVSPSGWIQCHAYGREDKNPSAGVYVGDGPLRGRYKDFGGGGESLSLWDFAAKVKGCDWKDAVREYARQTGVKLPTAEDVSPRDQFDFFDLTFGITSLYAKKKPPITEQAIREAGGIGARWPRKAHVDVQQRLIVFPAYGEGGLNLDAIGYGFVEARGQMVRLFRGKGVEPELHKTLTKGKPGLMNRWALRHLKDADVVWLVEGITDMLTMQALIPEDQKTRQVALTTGACTYHIQPDWKHHFDGKQVVVCFDNDSDADENAGQKNAAAVISQVVDVAKSVRNVVLPCNDIRDFLTVHPFSLLQELAAASPIIEPAEAKQNAPNPFEGLLHRLGVMVIGQVVDSDAVEIYSTNLRKRSVIKDISRFSYESAILALGGETVRNSVSEATEVPAGMTSMKNVRSAIADAAAGRQLSGNRAIGAGVWEAGGKVLLVDKHQFSVWDGQELKSENVPAFGEQRISFAEESWYSHTQLASYLTLARDEQWRVHTLDEAAQLFGRWNNWVYGASPQIVAALVCSTWVQTVWRLRPMVSIIGASNTGKSVLLDDCLARMFGEGIVFSINKPTEPGIRQNVGHSAKVVLVDELEEGRHRAEVLELLRNSSRGGIVARGSSNQKGITFGLKHLVWLGSIELGLKHEADRNRFIQLELRKLPKGAPNQLVLPTGKQLEELGKKLLAIAVYCVRDAVEMADVLSSKSYQTDRRVADCYGVPAAMWGVARGLPPEIIEGTLRHWLSERDFSSQDGDEEEELLQAILGAKIPAPGCSWTVAQILGGSSQLEIQGRAASRHDLLESVGIRQIGDYVFFATEPVKTHLLRGTDYARLDIAQILARIEGAQRARIRVPQYARGVKVPIDRMAGISISFRYADEPDGIADENF